MDQTARPWHPEPAMLELVELVASGYLARLPEILSWPGEVPSGVREHLSGAGAKGVVVEDAEGTPVAHVQPDLGVLPLRPFAQPPLRSHRRTAGQIREQLAMTGVLSPGPVVLVPVCAAPLIGDVTTLVQKIAAQRGRIIWLGLTASGAPLPPERHWRAVRALCDEARAEGVPAVAVPIVAPVQLQGPLLDSISTALGADQVQLLPEAPQGAVDLYPSFARELEAVCSSAERRGVTVFFTGLSGSGKSTVAKALAERLVDDGRRAVTLLDGDEVRRLLSAGLGFGRADRDLNIQRIGFVAAEVTRHGGMAICAPIAPFDQVRQQVRSRVAEFGDFILVHVSTPLEECIRRDRKGLYEKALRGEIPEFTGVSSPYEEPLDAEVTIDTTGLPLDDAVDRLWGVLVERGYLG